MAKTILEADPGHAAARQVASASTVQPEQLMQLLQASSGFPGAVVPADTLEKVMHQHRCQRLHAGVSLVVASQPPEALDCDRTGAVQLTARSEGVDVEGWGLEGGRWQNECMDNVLPGWSAEERLIIKLEELTWAALANQVCPIPHPSSLAVAKLRLL